MSIIDSTTHGEEGGPLRVDVLGALEVALDGRRGAVEHDLDVLLAVVVGEAPLDALVDALSPLPHRLPRDAPVQELVEGDQQVSVLRKKQANDSVAHERMCFD